jgi:hypothetical protein
LEGFVENLLPRLRALDFIGLWPRKIFSSAPLQLPHLRTLTLRSFGSCPPPWTWFVGARPLELWTDTVMIERWPPPEDGDCCAAAASGALFCPLASVQTLHVASRPSGVFTPTNVARLLRAAPQLGTLVVFASRVATDESWLAHPALSELVHLKLKRVRLFGIPFTTPPSVKCLTRLRQHQFPRLKGVAIDGRECFVTPLESS